jgi:hypothetical protein
MENTFLEDNYVIRTVENHRSFRRLSAQFWVNISNLWNCLSFTSYIEMNRNFSYGNTYTHLKTIFPFFAKINLKYKRWQLY